MRIKEGRQCQKPGGAQYPQQPGTGYADHFHQCPGEVLYAGECDPVLCDDDHVCLDRVFDLQHGTSVEGWMSLMTLISFGFFMMSVMLTLIFKYLSVILNMSFKRQHYVIEGVEKLTK